MTTPLLEAGSEGPGSAVAAEGITVTFGGVTALDDVSIRVEQGALTGLIGPNGAGKSTLFNVCSGTVRPRRGTVSLLGRDVTGLASHARAQRGLGRTFQRMELFDSLSVADNVRLGREARLTSAHPWAQLVAGRRDRPVVEEAAIRALDRCGLTALADRPVGTLPTGQRRLVELARVLAGGFEVLLLDEPSSGLDDAETEEFGRILAEITAEEGRTVLLVEHDMGLVMSICRHIYVLDFGKLVFQGSPSEVQASEVVRAAYLGSEVGPAGSGEE